jgi:hypothetical protein
VAAGQVDFLGPGVLSRGAGQIGTRAGQAVDLRFFGSVTGIYDNQYLPVSVDSKGNIQSVSGLYGMEAGLGAYGVRQWRQARLGLDYTGTFRHYSQQTYYDGSDHQLSLGYTYQKSRRLIFDFRETAGTLSRGTTALTEAYTLSSPQAFNGSNSLLFDNRAYFVNTAMDVSFLPSARTILTIGGQGFLVRRQSSALVGVNGYNLRGSYLRRLSRDLALGVVYQHVHFDYPRAFGEADINDYQATISRNFGRYWTISANGGIFHVEAQGLQQISLDPAVAAILGVSTGVQAFYRSGYFPTGGVQITRRFKNAQIAAEYGRSVSAGNGVYLTSRSESATAGVTYTGIKRWSLSLMGGYTSLSSVAQNLKKYATWSGGGAATYGIGRWVYVVARYDARHQEIDLANFRHTSYRATIGLAFSPGEVPLTIF